jgi:tryptophan 2,3-dioxygenase
MADAESSAETLAAGAHTDFSKSMTYSDYLHLDELLGAQQPLSDNHDEMLFIVIHHSTELWMKLVLHELEAARRLVAKGDLQPAFKCMARVSRIQALLIQSWDILSTMTPSEYLLFRDKLGQSSGFQSLQYRQIEFLFGNKQKKTLLPHKHRPDMYKKLEEALAAPSLYDHALRVLARRGFAIAPAVLERDVSEPYVADPSVTAAWLQVYRAPETYWDLYQLAEELVDLEDSFQQWRFRHVTTVQRIIGFKRGTGGTAGVDYLRRALDIVFFPELWTVRTEL